MQGLTVFRSRLFWRLFLSFVAVLLLTGLCVDRLVGTRVEGMLLHTLERQLRETVGLLDPYAAELLAGPRSRAVEPEAVEAEILRLGQDSELRLTLIQPDGRVLADSDEDPALMENHGARPEVVQARAAGTAVVRRYSRTLGIPMLYATRTVVREGETLGVLRVALPIEGLEREVGAVRGQLALALGAGLVLALLLGTLLARWAAAPIVAMTRAAAAIRDGAHDTPVPRLAPDDDVGRLADTLRELGAQVTRRIATISQDDAQLRAMLAGMVEGVVAVDEEDRVLFSNGAARRLLGLDADPRARRLWEQAPNAALEELIQEARETQGAGSGEIELHRAGREVVIQAHASTFRGGGRSGVVVVVHDLSDLRRLENIRRDFVANVSHELKTPLAAIKGFVETLLGGALRDEEHGERFLKRIDANVDRLSLLVNDLLSLARIEAQEGRLELAPTDWNDVIESVLRRHLVVAERKGLGLSAAVPPRAERVTVLGDREAMTQVLDNLVDNAIKYTPEGRVAIALAREGDQAVLRVHDTGLGIPPADRERIFERFYRVDKARSRELGGTGLGLSIVKHLVLSMGGSVAVESQPGRGSTFTVRLPLAD